MALFNVQKARFQLLWRPKEDISTHELALCIKLIVARGETECRATFDALPDNAKRHFEVAQ